MGKKKIPISLIENEELRRRTFLKRYPSLMRKASELSILCGTEMTLGFQDPLGNFHCFTSGETISLNIKCRACDRREDSHVLKYTNRDYPFQKLNLTQLSNPETINFCQSIKLTEFWKKGLNEKLPQPRNKRRWSQKNLIESIPKIKNKESKLKRLSVESSTAVDFRKGIAGSSLPYYDFDLDLMETAPSLTSSQYTNLSIKDTWKRFQKRAREYILQDSEVYLVPFATLGAILEHHQADPSSKLFQVLESLSEQELDYLFNIWKGESLSEKNNRINIFKSLQTTNDQSLQQTLFNKRDIVPNNSQLELHDDALLPNRFKWPTKSSYSLVTKVKLAINRLLDLSKMIQFNGLVDLSASQATNRITEKHSKCRTSGLFPYYLEIEKFVKKTSFFVQTTSVFNNFGRGKLLISSSQDSLDQNQKDQKLTAKLIICVRNSVQEFLVRDWDINHST